MKTFFPEIIEVEKYLQGRLSGEDAVVFEAKLVLSGALRKHTFFQRMVYRLVTLYGRKKKRAEIESVHTRLFNDPDKASYREHILKLFKL